MAKKPQDDFFCMEFVSYQNISIVFGSKAANSIGQVANISRLQSLVIIETRLFIHRHV